MKKTSLICGCLMWGLVYAENKTIPIITIDHDGHDHIYEVGEAEYQQALTESVEQIPFKLEDHHHIELDALAIGLAFDFGFGIKSFNAGFYGLVDMHFKQEKP